MLPTAQREHALTRAFTFNFIHELQLPIITSPYVAVKSKTPHQDIPIVVWAYLPRTLARARAPAALAPRTGSNPRF
jgi:hypothetical protein